MPSDVREAIATHQISEPCAVDNLHKLRDAFGNDAGYVPAYYLFDGEGKLKSFAAGERGLDMMAAALERLLAKKPAPPEQRAQEDAFLIAAASVAGRHPDLRPPLAEYLTEESHPRESLA